MHRKASPFGQLSSTISPVLAKRRPALEHRSAVEDARVTDEGQRMILSDVDQRGAAATLAALVVATGVAPGDYVADYSSTESITSYRLL
ncbi:MAG: hypothetical protein GY724_29830 [Actinomycetia bacterium]|nr:hypothetical protein [Actinomycetes bacterium]